MTCLQVVTLLICPLLAPEAAVPAAALQQRAPLEIEIGGSYEILSGDRSNWQDAWIRVRQPVGPRQSVDVTGLRSERFGLVDYQVSAGTTFPLDDMTARLEGSLSPNADFLANWGVGGNLLVPLGGPWATRVGGGYQEYPGGQTVTGQFGGLEWRSGPLGASYRLGASQVDGDGGLAHTLSGTAFYAHRSHVTLTGTLGDRAVMIGPGEVVLGQARGVGLLGLHEIHPGLGISYHIGVDEHAGVFTRSRFQVGFRVLP